TYKSATCASSWSASRTRLPHSTNVSLHSTTNIFCTANKCSDFPPNNTRSSSTPTFSPTTMFSSTKMSNGVGPTIIGLTTADGGKFDMQPRVWRHFGVLRTTPSVSCKTFSQMNVPLPQGVSRRTAEKLIEWCTTHQAPPSPASPSSWNPPSPLGVIRPSGSERRELAGPSFSLEDRRFWAAFTLAQMRELLTAARTCRIQPLVQEAERYLRDLLRETPTSKRRARHGDRCVNCVDLGLYLQG
ncbi:uncharacterized protein IWZ02DRAFT_308624, partial [Phyllosticta citriasiana]|uniref:uncharacterized protein n=1 Tax=Phyllosticta citriasiana TaxID=595635 RepID=UPI0030FDC6C2